MADYDWIEMLERMQDIRLFCSQNVRRMGRGGITSAQELDLLSRVALSKEKMTPHALCLHMDISKSLVSRLIDHLEKKGDIQKEHDECDKRSYFLVVTKKGREELESMYAYYLEPVYRLRRQMGEEEFTELFRLIQRSNATVKTEQGEE